MSLCQMDSFLARIILFHVVGEGIGHFRSRIVFFKDATKPVKELPFPSVTICSPGLNMEAVEEALLEDFNR